MKTQARKRKPVRALEPWEQAIVEAIRSGKPLTGENGLFTPMIKRALEVALDGEMESHLIQEAASVDVKTNRRNGRTSKQMKGFELITPRDRDRTFEPEIVKKRQTTITAEIDQKILWIGIPTNPVSALYHSPIAQYLQKGGDQGCQRGDCRFQKGLSGKS